MRICGEEHFHGTQALKPRIAIMKMNRVQSAFRIARIDSEGIWFTDGAVIRFEECAGPFPDKRPQSARSGIAQRDITGKPPYFEFYTKGGLTRVVFDREGFFAKARNEKAFRDLQARLLALGYTSLDLS